MITAFFVEIYFKLSCLQGLWDTIAKDYYPSQQNYFPMGYLQTLTFLRVTNSFSAVVRLLISSSYLFGQDRQRGKTIKRWLQCLKKFGMALMVSKRLFLITKGQFAQRLAMKRPAWPVNQDCWNPQCGQTTWQILCCACTDCRMVRVAFEVSVKLFTCMNCGFIRKGRRCGREGRHRNQITDR